MKRNINGSFRGTVLEYAKKNYNTEAEFMWVSAPNHAVLRHGDNRKWYGIIMDIPRFKLGLDGDEFIDVLNIKCDPILIGSLIDGNGFLTAYHMNKSNWITVLLDGTVDINEIFSLLDLSYSMTAPKKRKNSAG